jgi:uncharacterized membrane protein YeaQ/YmgE (transglycosylase-associated protein family)
MALDMLVIYLISGFIAALAASLVARRKSNFLFGALALILGFIAGWFAGFVGSFVLASMGAESLDAIFTAFWWSVVGAGIGVWHGRKKLTRNDSS